MTKLWEQLTLKQKVTRWSHAVRVIENLSPHEIEQHFDMGEWAYKNACGTIGCAAGQCAMDPKIRRQGFKLNWKLKLELTEGERPRAWFSIPPWQFYGSDAYTEIFTRDEFIYKKGIKAHTVVLKAMKDYLQELKDQAV